jgi:ADP-ribose pyrophosphatase YjhB (NUDIX family)
VWWNDHILLVHNSYQGSLTLPSGGIINTERPLDGAKRELEQEVGIVDDKDELQFLTTFMLDHDNMHDEIFVFELACDAKPTIKIDNREVTHAQFERLNDALALELTAVTSHILNYYASRKRQIGN